LQASFTISPDDEDNSSAVKAAVNAQFVRFFDIVNGFLIDAVAHRAQLWGRKPFKCDGTNATLTDVESG
jgi:hypothetical protein